ncbi:hypothetical protein SAMN04490243_1203 [Robiginitalea myxolifaciens]|uniref:Uncharacterized protein n=1 Tax=Robiginitalea myxolifaciens TaxID=400055 RepID=A0A1I6G3Z2_9FLAO|nr:hypothetical protein [Robiginitalea myxolifaciens]SFR36915.1 hypothetical protein SAMN04490243_1203 [Robiginitalea myxolifaciens]
MTAENKLQIARFGAGLILILLVTAALLIYQQVQDGGMLEETAHRLSIQYNSFSTGLAGK